MFSISDMKIGTRLALGFCLVLLCSIVLLALGLWKMSELKNGTNAIVNNKVASLSNAMDMREVGWSVALSLRKIAAPTDAKKEIQAATVSSRFAYGPAIAIGSVLAALAG